ncbi:NADP-dependent malic enzyme [Candidatus Bathyarchaeota archaeon]|nr:NADP-dependent malic enzyme [Candidatus Bathyarchaeota archaeon]
MLQKDRVSKAELPGNLALKYHPFYQGKIEVVPKCIIRDSQDFSIWYTPGVAEPCKAIAQNKELSFEYTSRWNFVAVVSDCSRVLGLGNIGAPAGLPVMEGKSLLYKYLGGVDSFPLVLSTQKEDDIVNLCKWIEPSVGGINLEDIESPKCYNVLDKARKALEIPVWHDDRQGTATVTLAAFVNALKLVGKKENHVTVALIGAGAANTAVLEFLLVAGVNPGNVFMVDTKGILNTDRKGLENVDPVKWKIATTTNAEGRVGGIQEALRGVDVCVALSRSGPGIIKKEWIKAMADDAIVFPCANPNPEIWPWEAKEAGARIVATGRSDFPNQVNNSLGFPGIFRGTLDVRAKTITDEMCIAAAMELAKIAEDKGLSEDNIVPKMEEWEVFPREAIAVGMKAMETGVSRIKLSREELTNRVYSIIGRAREETAMMMRNGLIKPLPE